jgi:hypothetical protein
MSFSIELFYFGNHIPVGTFPNRCTSKVKNNKYKKEKNDVY